MRKKILLISFFIIGILAIISYCIQLFLFPQISGLKDFLTIIAIVIGLLANLNDTLELFSRLFGKTNDKGNKISNLNLSNKNVNQKNIFSLINSGTISNQDNTNQTNLTISSEITKKVVGIILNYGNNMRIEFVTEELLRQSFSSNEVIYVIDELMKSKIIKIESGVVGVTSRGQQYL